ncbi:DUF2190 family protein [Paracoccus saliphilus]|uniref:DUF2190 family protein n=1 Tax=Paracoccus saliphilus TaxID=405559 RepID=A0AA46A4Z0_9RHOB|nr:DUF2190 family protein [Paracoccus saliphilus]WCR04999.1 DUF2190 family protein [Paracoccus saliphilus]SIS71507.1 Predicted phage recombinase, RecA/RadA family [Paracoccus saliphilus]
MRNYVQNGSTIDLTAPTGGLVSGQAALIGALFGVAATDAAEGRKVAVAVEGVFDLPKVAGTGLTEGVKAYWTGTEITSTATGNTLVGHVVEAAAAAATVCRVRLNN